MSNLKRLISEQEAAERLGTTRGTLRQERQVRRWGLPFVRLGRAIRYDPEDIDRFIEQHREGGERP